MTRPGLLTILLFTAATAMADEWGSWDDLPDNLLSTGESTTRAIDQLYERLRSDDAQSPEELNAWLMSLELEFSNSEEWQDLMDDLRDEPEEDVIEEIQEWLEEQADDVSDDLEDLLDEQEDAEEDRLKEEEDRLEEEEDAADELETESAG